MKILLLVGILFFGLIFSINGATDCICLKDSCAVSCTAENKEPNCDFSTDCFSSVNLSIIKKRGKSKLNLIANGGFENQLAGWTQFSLSGVKTFWEYQTGNSFHSEKGLPRPPNGNFAAMTQSGESDGSATIGLYQDFTFDEYKSCSIIKFELSFKYYLRNYATDYLPGDLIDPTPTGATGTAERIGQGSTGQGPKFSGAIGRAPGPHATGPHATGPHATGPGATGTGATGTGATGTGSTGTGATGTGSTGTGATGTGATGTGATGTGTGATGTGATGTGATGTGSTGTGATGTGATGTGETGTGATGTGATGTGPAPVPSNIQVLRVDIMDTESNQLQNIFITDLRQFSDTQKYVKHKSTFYISNAANSVNYDALRLRFGERAHSRLVVGIDDIELTASCVRVEKSKPKNNQKQEEDDDDDDDK